MVDNVTANRMADGYTYICMDLHVPAEQSQVTFYGNDAASICEDRMNVYGIMSVNIYVAANQVEAA